MLCGGFESDPCCDDLGTPCTVDNSWTCEVAFEPNSCCNDDAVACTDDNSWSCFLVPADCCYADLAECS